MHRTIFVPKAKGQKVVSIVARKMSASARRKIAAAQRLRWAKWKRGRKGRNT